MLVVLVHVQMAWICWSETYERGRFQVDATTTAGKTVGHVGRYCASENAPSRRLAHAQGNFIARV